MPLSPEELAAMQGALGSPSSALKLFLIWPCCPEESDNRSDFNQWSGIGYRQYSGDGIRPYFSCR